MEKVTEARSQHCDGCHQKCFGHVRKNLLLVLTMCGVVLGFALGFGIRETKPTTDQLMWIGFLGDLYLRLLKMMIVPLIVCSVISGTASLDPKSNGKISLISLIFIVITNTIGSILGVAAGAVFQPGKGSSFQQSENTVNSGSSLETQDIIADLIRNFFPDNLLEAAFRKTQTRYNTQTVERNTSNGTMLADTVVKLTKTVGKTDSPNIIGLIVACTLIGIAASTLKEKGRPLLNFFVSASEIVIVIVRWFMWTTPIGVISLIAVAIAGTTDIVSVFGSMGMLVATVAVAIVIQQLIVMPAILFAFTKRNPYAFLLSIARPWIIGFASTSTAVAIPEMIASCEDTNKIDRRVVRFVIPFSVTLSANGSALYMAAASIFCYNLSGAELSAFNFVLIGILSTVASMAIPSVPSASIVSIVMILNSLGLPVDMVSLLIAMEWILDRLRTTSSVVSHTMCAAVTYKLCKENLRQLDMEMKVEEKTEKMCVSDQDCNTDLLNVKL
ncbi:hypothetical protein CHS0354_001219 [Potamilus streckersoni]|uniref:Amino acid transporter n=1 Tax=Potamilus streckersoni TaxID=2493646 RepID=A0AAE0RV35_9BIVA|nr:hypothetical protein CHS0354_001219 [Potamilus streckersoni]